MSSSRAAMHGRSSDGAVGVGNALSILDDTVTAMVVSIASALVSVRDFLLQKRGWQVACASGIRSGQIDRGRWEGGPQS